MSFFVVYIREAHPEDGWAFTMNRLEGITVNDPTTDAQRWEVAVSCALHLELEIPVLVDRVDDAVGRAYGAWPDRLYLVGSDGKISYQGAVGPFGFRLDELEAALADAVGEC